MTPDRSIPSVPSASSDSHHPEEPIVHGTVRVVQTTSVEPIDLEGWARRYALAVLAVERAGNGSAAA